MEYKIDTGVPIPPRNPRTGKSIAIRRLKAGQSVMFPKANADTVRALLYQLRKRGLIGTFTVRKVDGGARVWRTE